MKTISVIGAGSWGTALSLALHENCPDITLWARREKLCEDIEQSRENREYLPGVTLPDSLTVTADMEKAVKEKDALALVVPSHTVRHIARQAAPYVTPGTVIISCAKGLEEKTHLRMSEVLREELPLCRIAVLSGPNHAEEVSRRIPSATVVSADSRKLAEAVQDLFMTSFLRVYTNPDLLGVELAAALKNVIALGVGISDGLGFGDNTKAALMTRGITEIARLGQKQGADLMTFAGLAGIGDLVVTCTSRHSRNRQFGMELGRGKTADQVLAEMRMVAEGVKTTAAARELAEKNGVEMPITSQVYAVLYQGKPPRQAVETLMKRGKTHEQEDIVSGKYNKW